jgi:hypothetical protein
MEAKIKQHVEKFKIEISKKVVDLLEEIRPLPERISACEKKVENYGDQINAACQKNIAEIIDRLKVDTLRV